MHKRIWLALVLVFALVLSSSCSLVAKDESVEMATVVLEVNGRSFTKAELQEQIDACLDYYEYIYYYYYGYTFDRTDEAVIADAQNEAIAYLTQMALVDAKIAEYGFDVFTEEELAEIEAAAKEEYDLYYETVLTFFFADTELTGDELKAAVDAELASMGYSDYEGLLEEMKYTRSQEKLVELLNKDIAVSEEEVTTGYAARVEADKATYTANPGSYGTDILDGVTLYYAPEGYRYVKHILLQYLEEDQALIEELELTISEKQEALAALAEGEDPVAINAEIEQLEADLLAARDAALVKLQPKADEIKAKLAEGVDFETLIAEYNEDEGMAEETEGYAVSADSTDWVTEFKDASMALAAVGDVSEAVPSYSGLHFIRYLSDIPAGEIGLETVREALTAELLAEKQSANISALLTEWEADAKIVIHEKKLK